MPVTTSTFRAALALSALVLGSAPFSPVLAASLPESALVAPEAGREPSALALPETLPGEPAGIPQTGHSGASPSGSLAIGLIATAAPLVIAANAQPGTPNARYDRSGMMVLAAAAGVAVGPAIGLASGGRGDLAARGLLLRVAGLGMVSLGVLSAMYAYEGGSSGAGAFALGVGGAALTVGSAVYDLGITPSAVADRQVPRASLGVRPDGMLAVSVRF